MSFDGPSANFTGFTSIYARGDLVGRYRVGTVWHGFMVSGFSQSCSVQ
jgi:hypothetical protein